jgi:predicted small secreted protein
MNKKEKVKIKNNILMVYENIKGSFCGEKPEKMNKKEKVKIKNNILKVHENIKGSCCGVYSYRESKSSFILKI